MDLVLSLQTTNDELTPPSPQLPPRLREDLLLNVEAAPSPRHGLGAFTKRHLPAFTIGSLYPVHALGIGTSGNCTDDDAAYFAGLEAPSAYRLMLLHHSLHAWAPGMWCDANPTRPHAAGWLAHLANDAAVCRAATEASLLAYYAQSQRDCNSMLVPFGEVVPLMALCTTRDVAAGEELLIPYGHNFWLEYFQGAPVADDASVEHEDGRDIPVAAAPAGYSIADVQAQIRSDTLTMARAALALQSAYEGELRELGKLLDPKSEREALEKI